MIHYLVSFFTEPPVIAISASTFALVIALCKGASNHSA